MAKERKMRGFGRWDVVVVLIVVGLLLVFIVTILIPLRARTRSVAFRSTCGTNLSSIGKAIFIYANDYEDELPRAGGPMTQWTGRTPNWKAEDRRAAFGLAQDGTGGEASIGASLYLLVKYSEVKPREFVCGGKTLEPGVTEFRPRRYGVRDADATDLWDFGPDPTRHVSYAYHMVHGPHRLTLSGKPGMAILADRNPWMDSPAAKARDFSHFRPDVPPFNGTAEQARSGNTIRHNGDGQNVLFLDSHVEFAKRPYCGHEEDNIYTSWDGDDWIRGLPPKLGSQPADRYDSLLVNDPAVR